MSAPILVARPGIAYDSSQLIFTASNGLTFSVSRLEFDGFGYIKRYSQAALPQIDNTPNAGVTYRQDGELTIKMEFDFFLILTLDRWAEFSRIIEYQRSYYSRNNERSTTDTSIIMKDNRIAAYEGLFETYVRADEPYVSAPFNYDRVDQVLYPGWYWSTYRIVFTDINTQAYGDSKISVTAKAVETFSAIDPAGYVLDNTYSDVGVTLLQSFDYDDITEDTFLNVIGYGTLDVVYPYSDGFGLISNPFQLSLLYYTDSTNRTSGFAELVYHQAHNSGVAQVFEIPGIPKTTATNPGVAEPFVAPERAFFTKVDSDKAYLLVTYLTLQAKLYELSDLSLGTVTFTEVAIGSPPSTTGINPYNQGFIDLDEDLFLFENTTLTPIGSTQKRVLRYDVSADAVTDPLTSVAVGDFYFFYDNFRDNLLRNATASTIDNTEVIATVGQANTAGDNIYNRAGINRPIGGAIFGATIAGTDVRYFVDPTNGDLYSYYNLEKFQVQDGGTPYVTLIDNTTLGGTDPAQVAPFVKHQTDQGFFTFNRCFILANASSTTFGDGVTLDDVGFINEDTSTATTIRNGQELVFGAYGLQAIYGGYCLADVYYVYGVENTLRQAVNFYRVIPFN